MNCIFIAQDTAGRTSARTQLFSLDGSRPTLDLIPAFLLLTDFFTLVSSNAFEQTSWQEIDGFYQRSRQSDITETAWSSVKAHTSSFRDPEFKSCSKHQLSVGIFN